TEHMLQAAYAAEQEGAPPRLVAAAQLHDYGHFIHDLPEDAAEHGIDTQHEEVPHAFLSEHFGPEIAEPIRLHVAAKRYLCAIVGAPVAVFFWELHAAVWPFLVATSALETMYFALLAFAYTRAELSVVYPLARGLAPVLVLAGAVAFTGAETSGRQIVGVLLV